MQITNLSKYHHSQFIQGSDNEQTLSPFICALTESAQLNLQEATKQLLSQVFEPNNERWQGYLAILQASFNENDHSSLIELAELALELLADDSYNPQFSNSAKGTQLNALLKHVELLLDFTQPKLAQSLLKAFMERGIIKEYFDSVPNLWLKASIKAMEKPEEGLDSFFELLVFDFDRDKIDSNILNLFCQKLAEISQKNGNLTVKGTFSMISFLSLESYTLSHREELAALLLPNIERLGLSITGKDFIRISSFVGLQAVSSSIEPQCGILLKEGRIGPCLSLLIRASTLDPLPFSHQKISSFFYQIMNYVLKDGNKRYMSQIAQALTFPIMAKCAIESGTRLIKQERFSEAKEWAHFLTDQNILIPEEARDAFICFIMDLTWNNIDDENCRFPDQPLRNLMEKRLLSYDEIVCKDADFLIELADHLNKNGRSFDACKFLYQDHAASSPQRIALFTRIIRGMIREKENEEITIALTQFKTTERIISLLWEEFLLNLLQSAFYTPDEYEDYFKGLFSYLEHHANPSLEIASKGLMLAYQKQDLVKCFHLVSRHFPLYEDFCKCSSLEETEVDKVKIWIDFIDYLKNQRSPLLIEIIKEPPHKVAGGVFPSFNTMPVEQSVFFHQLFYSVGYVINYDNDEAFIHLLALRQKLEPLYSCFEHMTARIYIDIILSHWLVQSKNETIFLTGIHFFSDATRKFALLLIPYDNWQERWEELMVTKVAFPSSPLLLPTMIQENLPKMPLESDSINMANLLSELKGSDHNPVHDVFQLINHRVNNPAFVLTRQTAKVLSKMWPGIACCIVAKSEQLEMANRIYEAGVFKQFKCIRILLEQLI